MKRELYGQQEPKRPTMLRYRTRYRGSPSVTSFSTSASRYSCTIRSVTCSTFIVLCFEPPELWLAMEICTSLTLRAAEILICGRSPVVAFILPFLRKVFAVAVILGFDNARWTSPVGFATAQRWTSTGILQ